MARQVQSGVLATVVGLSLLVLGPTGVAQHPPTDPNLGPTMTPKQQREWLQWNHRRVQRDVRRLVELAEEVADASSRLPQDKLAATQQESIKLLREKAAALNQDFEKINPHILPLGVVRNAEAIEEQAKTLHEFFETEAKGSQELAHLSVLTREVQERAKRVADRLIQP